MRNQVLAAARWESVFSLRAACGAVLVLLVTAGGAFAADWPQWRGPNRDGISKETGLLRDWPKEGPKLLWHVTDLGDGYSTPAIVGGRLYVLSNKGNDNEFVQARDSANGEEIWTTRLGKVGNPNQQPNYAAARSTPTVEGDVLYALGSDGDLACLEIGGGTVRWQKNLRTDFKGKPGTWAYSESPLIDGDELVCTPGGSEATLVSLSKKTGEVIWRSPLPEADEAAYASAILVEAAGKRQIVQLLQKGLVGVDAKSGKFLWRYSKPVSRFNANIPTPVAGDGFVYAGSAGTGGGAVKLNASQGGVDAEQVYFDVKMPAAIGGAVKIGDYLYGTTAQALLCIEFATGQVKWQERALGAAAICYADGCLYLHGENGEVALVEPSPDSYREKGRFTPPDQPKRANSMEKAWAYPAVADGRLYVRDRGTLWCYAVK
ncbi:MAG: PQQ-like beta-propeller repeat protein [Planctomycetia bacterium]|nr:PQQ-like beta-propeller repeat protein [Planctomycetia bacterium]